MRENPKLFFITQKIAKQVKKTGQTNWKISLKVSLRVFAKLFSGGEGGGQPPLRWDGRVGLQVRRNE